jgi:hypothetical protein
LIEFQRIPKVVKTIKNPWHPAIAPLQNQLHLTGVSRSSSRTSQVISRLFLEAGVKLLIVQTHGDKAKNTPY